MTSLQVSTGLENSSEEHLSSLVQKLKDKNHDRVISLRQITPLLTFKGKNIQYPKELIHTLCSLLEDVTVIGRFRYQVCHVLRSILPCRHVSPDRSFQDPLCRSLMLGASTAPSAITIGQLLMCAVNGDVNIENPLQNVISACRAVTDYFELLSPEQVGSLSSTYCDWLRNASTQQAVNPTSISLFKKGDLSKPMTEIDGATTNEFFTVLNICQYYTEDQYINIYCFSTLLSYLVHSPPEGLDKQMRTRLYDVCVDYCLRIVDQWEKKPKFESDREVQNAAVIEAVSILDHICLCNASYVPKVFEVIKRLYSHIGANSSQTPIVINVLQVFLNHGDGIMYNYDQPIELFLGELISKLYMDTRFAFDAIVFIEDNIDKLQQMNVLQKYFPNLLKILAYNPRCYLREFIKILPAFLSTTTVSEVLHSILDLPCMTAIMCRRQSQSSSVGESTGDVASLQRSLFNFMMRNEGGQGDTINRLSDVHNYLRDLSTHTRVVTCSQTVPVLLRVFFNVVLQDVSFTTANLLQPLILERSCLLYDIPAYKHDVLKLFADSLVELFKQQPELLMKQQCEIQEFIGSLRNVKDKEDFFIHLVWIVGEHCSTRYISQCTPELTCSFYETVECLAYEICGQKTDALTYSSRLILTLMSTLVKLASRCQDLIPRVLLCLTKLSQPRACVDDETGVIPDYATQLFSLLKLPNVASEVLSPSKELSDGRCHYDNASMSSILHMMTSIVQQEPSS